MRLNEFFPDLTESLAVGDPVIITGNVEFQGKTGDVRELGQNGSFVVVDLYNYGPQSFQASDVSRNDYADSEDVVEGELATYMVRVMDAATGEHWRIEVEVTSPEMAKERAEAMGYKVLGVEEKGVAEAEKNPHTSALGKALHRDLSKEKKASPQQVQRNKERWAKRQAEREQGLAEGSLNEFAPDKEDGNDSDYREYLRGYKDGQGVLQMVKSSRNKEIWATVTPKNPPLTKPYLQGWNDAKYGPPSDKNLIDLNKLGEQGVAEGYDSEELANEVYAEFERMYPNLARRANERTVHAAIMDVLNYGGDNDPAALAQDVARAVKRDIEQDVTEVSKATIDRYVAKASDAHGDADFKARMSKHDPDKRSYHVDQKKTAEKRRQGISRALDRMSRQEDVAEGYYDYNDYYDAHRAGEYGRPSLSWHGGGLTSGGGETEPVKTTEPLPVGRPKKSKGITAQLPADPFGRTTGAIPKSKPGQTFSQGTPDERAADKKYAVENNDEKVGNMDADKFDDAMARLKQLAGAGPLKTVYDPQKRVYKNVPTAVQPQTQPKK
jgi:hypothetical protein